MGNDVLPRGTLCTSLVCMPEHRRSRSRRHAAGGALLKRTAHRRGTLALQAGLWGLLSGSALLLGAMIGYRAQLPRAVIASIMAFGAGVLIAALAFELMEDTYARGGFDATAIGFLSGAVVYTVAGLVAVAGFLTAFMLSHTRA